jgi:hypothetical protein
MRAVQASNGLYIHHVIFKIMILLLLTKGYNAILVVLVFEFSFGHGRHMRHVVPHDEYTKYRARMKHVGSRLTVVV